ncbi:transposase domain-containing protein [Brevibacterium limosum]|uniref:transposase domain-containing protein n=1 Tax=Brevibacterium limosum TaxID=2697565 RepID=UPI001AA1488B|nr:transposase domain-containing protein [Brevibacterium limosum]
MHSHTLTDPHPDTATTTIDAYTPGHLGELTHLLPDEMVDAAIEETHSRQKRLRDLPSRVVVYLLIAACLFPDIGYTQVWSKLVARWPTPSGPGPSAGRGSSNRPAITGEPATPRRVCWHWSRVGQGH